MSARPRPRKPASPPSSAPDANADAKVGDWAVRILDRDIAILEKLADIGFAIVGATPSPALARARTEQEIRKTLLLQATLMAQRQRLRGGRSAADAVPGPAGPH